MNNKDIYIGKKHWIVYVVPILVFLVSSFFLYQFTTFTKRGEHQLLVLGLIIFGIPMLLSALILFSKRNIVWRLTDNELVITGGYLPWSKSHFEIPFEDIYESFYSIGFLGHILGYANVSVRRTEGVTTDFKVTRITQFKEITENINSRIRQIKKGSNEIKLVTSVIENSISSELEKFANLRDKGILTEDEFLMEKKKLLNR